MRSGHDFGPLASAIATSVNPIAESAPRTAFTRSSSLLPSRSTSGTCSSFRFWRQRWKSRTGVIATIWSTDAPSMPVAG